MAGTKSIDIGGYGFRPNKRLGQHFLRDRSVIQQIINRAGFEKSDHIMEIGPGLGALTIPLAGLVQRITAIEKDSQLTDILGEKLSGSGVTNVTLINEDILRLDLKGLRKGSAKKIKVIGNLPYNISSPFLEKLINHRDLISMAVLMFQYEFARRLLSTPGGKEYGAITVLTRYNAAVSQLIEVSKEAFYPRPKVGSMVLSIDMERPYPERARDELNLKRVVKGAFAHRRKTVLNSLKGALPSSRGDEISAALKRCGIDPKRRAETIDIDEFLSLASELNPGPL
ncbi:16S rRNA (adenine(1518)-N(6)/adenine(1519)-N(6))-dimethyltransferase RsmA [Deltaproteobacteria bacterium]|nr:16S rRNA (adenine(1518)-N(6)/adenine(1519)-N(6))-dimethyltransferase RsmA [Deltaproteobacteria bacterium]